MATTRSERQSAGRSARRTRRRVKTGVSIVAVAAIVVVAYLAYEATPGQPGVRFADQGNVHIANANDPHEPYNSDPPTSGPHLPYIAPWGIHTRPIPRELQVHNLEDGGVVIQYSCECPDVVDKLKRIVDQYDRQVILAPYPDMKARIALTAWTRRQTLDDVDQAKIARFIQAYRGIDHHK